MSVKIKDGPLHRGHSSKLDFADTFYIDSLLFQSKRNGFSLFKYFLI